MSKEIILNYIKEKYNDPYLIKEVTNALENKKTGLVYTDRDVSVEELLNQYPFEFLTTKHIDDLSIDADGPQNFLYEGDNIGSLAHLNHMRTKVDIIYIDPPYNTGNKQFAYNDAFKSDTGLYPHDSWLGFMDKRLKLSRELLTDDGVIFVSIDDKEQAQLKLLLDRIYGEDCFLGTIIQNKANAQNDAKSIQRNHEYIHVYTKKSVELHAKKLVHKVVEQDEHGWYYKPATITTGGARGSLNLSYTMGYTFYYNEDTKDVIVSDDYDKELAKISNNPDEIYTDNQELLDKGYIPIRPPNSNGKLKSWTWGIDSAKERLNELDFCKSSTGRYHVYKKKYVPSDKVVKKGYKYYYEDTVPRNSKSILDFPTVQGTLDLVDIFKDKVFNNPKSIDMLEYLIDLHPNKNATVLDFFAGSGSTGHAVLSLNKKDGGNRQFILCTNNEISLDKEKTYLEVNNYIPKYRKGTAYNNFIENYKETDEFKNLKITEEYKKLGICRSVTVNRVHSILKGYINKKGEQVFGLPGSLKYITCQLHEPR